jgi:YbgC/YbaW family acyl-CoA thioester hydrolase
MYFDTAVAGYWRALALPYFETLASLGGDLFVRKATLEYHASARYDDLISTGLRVARLGNSSMQFDGCVFRHGEPLVSCELVYVYADPATQTSRPVPQALRDVIAAFEAGEPMIDVATGTWSEHEDAARRIRREVFAGEFHAGPDTESDAADAGAVHALVRNRLGLALGAGRLVLEDVGRARIGRLAVRQSVRGIAIGRALLDALLDAARARGVREVLVHAHDEVVGFWRRAGFVEQGARWEEGGVTQVALGRPP